MSLFNQWNDFVLPESILVEVLLWFSFVDEIYRDCILFAREILAAVLDLWDGCKLYIGNRYLVWFIICRGLRLFGGIVVCYCVVRSIWKLALHLEASFFLNRTSVYNGWFAEVLGICGGSVNGYILNSNG